MSECAPVGGARPLNGAERPCRCGQRAWHRGRVLTIDEAMDHQADYAATKVAMTRRPVAYLVQGALAGAFVGVAVVLMLCAAGGLALVGSPMTKLVQGLVFGVALTLVLTAGGELAT